MQTSTESFISNFATEGQTRKANTENIQWDGASLEAFEKLKQKLNQKLIDCLLRNFQHVPIPFSILGIDNESNTCEGYNSNMRNT